MFSVCCTRKLLSRGAPKTVGPPRPATTVLGNWYANIVFTRPLQLVVCISEKTLLPVVVPAKDIMALPQRVAEAVERMLIAVGVPASDVARELHEMQDGHLSKTADRRVLGSLNDFVSHFLWDMEDHPDLKLQERALRLAEMPSGAIEYAFPAEATRAAFAAARVLAAAKSAA